MTVEENAVVIESHVETSYRDTATAAFEKSPSSRLMTPMEQNNDPFARTEKIKAEIRIEGSGEKRKRRSMVSLTNQKPSRPSDMSSRNNSANKSEEQLLVREDGVEVQGQIGKQNFGRVL